MKITLSLNHHGDACRLAVLVAALSSLLAGVTTAQVDPNERDGLFADSFCAKDFCLTGLYSAKASAINYTMIIAGTDFEGWRGVGQGSQMSGANMLVGWVSNGQPVWTHRSAEGHAAPTAGLAKGTIDLHSHVTRVSSTNGGMTVISWSFPQKSSPGNAFPHIWAAKSSDTPTGSGDTAHIGLHDEQGVLPLDLTLRYHGEAPKAPPGVTALAAYGGGTASTSSSSGSSSSSSGMGTSGRNLDTYHNRVWIAHMVFMILAWLILVPAAILVGRFGRGLLKWFPVHRNLHLAALVSLFIGFFLAVGATSNAKRAHFDGRHQKLGLSLFILPLAQALLGQFGHVFRRQKGVRVQNYVHIVLGLLLFCLAVWNFHLGFEAWVWWRVPNAASYVVYAWAAVLGTVYLGGMALLPRQLKDEALRGGFEKRTLKEQTNP